MYNNFSLFWPWGTCCGQDSYRAVHGVFAILGFGLLLSRFHGWSWLFLDLILLHGAGQLEEAQRPEVQLGDGHVGEEERRKAQHVEAGLVEGRRREVQSGKGQLGEPGARDEEGQLGEAQPGVDQLGEAQPGVDQLGEAQPGVD